MSQNRRTRSSPLSKLNSLFNDLYSKHAKHIIHNVLKASDMEQFKSLERKLENSTYTKRKEFLKDLEKALENVPIHHLTTITIINSRKKTCKLNESFNGDEVIGKINDDLQMMESHVRLLEESISPKESSQDTIDRFESMSECSQIANSQNEDDPNRTPNKNHATESNKRKKKSKKQKNKTRRKKKKTESSDPVPPNLEEDRNDVIPVVDDMHSEQETYPQEKENVESKEEPSTCSSSTTRRRIGFSPTVVFYEDLVECPLCQRKFTKYQIKIHMEKMHYDKDKTLQKRKAKLTKSIIEQVKASEMRKKLQGILYK
nr:unnamed protein product [Naegleria fowleri]